MHSIYAIVFMDAIHFNVKQDGMITKKAAYMSIGIDLDGKKDVLGIWIGENESAKFWLSVLNELKNRGVQDVLIFRWTILPAFPKRSQPVTRRLKFKSALSIKSVIRYDTFPCKDVKKITAALRPIYTAASEPAALEGTESVWKQLGGSKYPLIVRSWRQNWGSQHFSGHSLKATPTQR